MTREVFVVSAVRTAIGTFGGSLKDTPPTALGALVVRESLARANVSGNDVGHVVFGHVVNTEPRDMYLSRVAALDGGCAQGTPAFNVNRLCGSGLQAVVSAAQSILLGDADIAIGAGAENMSRAPYASLNTRFGATPSTWASRPRTSRPSGASAAKIRTSSLWKATTARNAPPRPVTSRTRSSR
jgi:acetyl-CoA C-acetyltransferase